jgi:hypothetical protein
MDMVIYNKAKCENNLRMISRDIIWGEFKKDIG